jgi:hypothetical protein
MHGTQRARELQLARVARTRRRSQRCRWAARAPCFQNWLWVKTGQGVVVNGVDEWLVPRVFKTGCGWTVKVRRCSRRFTELNRRISRTFTNFWPSAFRSQRLTRCFVNLHKGALYVLTGRYPSNRAISVDFWRIRISGLHTNLNAWQSSWHVYLKENNRHIDIDILISNLKRSN